MCTVRIGECVCGGGGTIGGSFVIFICYVSILFYTIFCVYYLPIDAGTIFAVGNHVECFFDWVHLTLHFAKLSSSCGNSLSISLYSEGLFLFDNAAYTVHAFSKE